MARSEKAMPEKEAPKRDVAELLNEAVALEYSAAIQFQTWAAFAEGLDGEQIGSVLREMAPGEIGHAQRLLDRLWALGEKPTMKVGKVRFLTDCRQILDGAIEVEEQAIAHYRTLFRRLTRKSMVLWETIEEIIEDEEQELEKLRRLRGR
ncbi:MAG: ferritin-like domain-containing protein [Candidatus Limnocylindria bacterium]